MLFWVVVLICFTTIAHAQYWNAAGSLITARELHTATLLPNGNVLVAGGDGTTEYTINSAELYNAATDDWILTGSLTYARDQHTATLLTNGNVLVAGGGGSGRKTAELYNVATGVWTVTGSLTYDRNSHTATLLPNGNVLVAGGVGARGFAINSAELYNAATNEWILTGSLTQTRSYHTATLLPNGNVLVAAGFSAFGYLNSAELYNATTGLWTVTGSLTNARYYHTATLLPNGNVLVTGGIFYNSNYKGDHNDDEYYNGDHNNDDEYYNSDEPYNDGDYYDYDKRKKSYNDLYLDSAELYNPITGVWTVADSLNIGRSEHTATLLPNGNVLVAGGRYGSGGDLNSAEVYNAATGVWTVTSSMTTPRVSHTATLLQNGLVLITGPTSELYSFEKNFQLSTPAATTKQTIPTTTTTSVSTTKPPVSTTTTSVSITNPTIPTITSVAPTQVFFDETIFAFKLFYGFVAVGCGIIGLVWLMLCAYHWEQITKVQIYCGGIIFLCLLEATCTFAYYTHWNSTGVDDFVLFVVSQLLTGVRSTVSLLALLGLCKGYGLVKDAALGFSTRFLMLGLGLCNFVSSIDHLVKRFTSVRGSTQYLSSTPPTFFYFWVPLLAIYWMLYFISKTIAQLSGEKQTEKRTTFVALRRVLLVSFAVLLVLTANLVINSNNPQYQLQWLIDDRSSYLAYCFVLMSVLYLFRPQHNNMRVGVDQVATEEPNDDFDVLDKKNMKIFVDVQFRVTTTCEHASDAI